MKTKHILFCLLAAVAMGFQSCGDDDSYDVEGNPDNLVYFKTTGEGVQTFTVVHTPAGDFGAFSVKLPVRILRPAARTTTVYAEVATSAVTAYNETHGTSYAAIPEGVIDASRMTVTIAEGSDRAADSVVVTIPETALPRLTEASYLVPIRIYRVEGDGTGSVERGTTYLVVNTEQRLLRVLSSATDIDGTLLSVADCASWTVSWGSGASYGTPAQLFDRNLTNGAPLRTDAQDGHNTVIVVDMQQPQNVSGLRVARYYSTGWWTEEYYFSSVGVELSDDGQTWTEAGTMAEADMPKGRGYQYIGFYGSATARYLRLTFESGASTVSSLAELGVYVSARE